MDASVQGRTAWADRLLALSVGLAATLAGSMPGFQLI